MSRKKNVIMIVMVGIVLFAFTGCALLSSVPRIPVGQHPQTFEPQPAQNLPESSQYLLFLPQKYYRKFWKRWPVILYLHGSSLRGDDINKVKTYGLPKLVEEMPDFPFILISPQCPKRQRWSPELLIALLDEIIEKYRVDKDRIYLTGVSLGGYGAWDTAITYPERFAAIAPVAGGGDPTMVHNLLHLPVWVFHGAQDRVVPISRSKAMVKALKACGGDVKFTIYPDGKHNIFTQVYQDPELYEWFLQHKRQKLS